ncbi:MAG TPA: HAD-IIA family hydrolase [Actinomycetota bacterium]
MKLAQAFTRFAFDLDGVIWRGTQPIEGAAATLRALRESGKRLCYVTNNSSTTAEGYVRKLAKLGAPADEREIVSSADATAVLLERDVPGIRGRLVFVIGGEGLTAAVSATGARIASPDEAADATVVVVGLDRRLTYDKLRLATLAIRSGAMFVASNADVTFPAAAGMWPGAGAIVAALRAATGVEPVVAGKPDPLILSIAGERLGGGPALTIGDRVETDVLAAHAAGWPSALVLTGATGVPELATAPAWPDFVLRRIGDLLEDRPHPDVRAAAGPDLPHVATLLHAGGLLSGAARERIARTIVADVDRRPIATAAWELAGGAALLRSVAVAAEHRTSGAGTVIVAAALRRIAALGVRDVYLGTTEAEGFFERCGFRPVEGDALPEPLAANPHVARECPPEATIMRLTLPPAHLTADGDERGRARRWS